jgi:hypothetical protein
MLTSFTCTRLFVNIRCFVPFFLSSKSSEKKNNSRKEEIFRGLVIWAQTNSSRPNLKDLWKGHSLTKDSKEDPSTSTSTSTHENSYICMCLSASFSFLCLLDYVFLLEYTCLRFLVSIRVENHTHAHKYLREIYVYSLASKLYTPCPWWWCC